MEDGVLTTSHADDKQNFCLVLMALVDSQYRLVYIDNGANGRQSGGQVFGITAN